MPSSSHHTTVVCTSCVCTVRAIITDAHKYVYTLEKGVQLCTVGCCTLVISLRWFQNSWHWHLRTSVCSCRLFIVLHCDWDTLVVLSLLPTGGRVVHCNGKLIPHEFPITDAQQITDADGKGRVTCTVSSGTARFFTNGSPLQSRGVTQIGNGATAILLVNLTVSLLSTVVYCTDSHNNMFYLLTSGAGESKVEWTYVNYVCTQTHEDNSASFQHTCTYTNILIHQINIALSHTHIRT